MTKFCYIYFRCVVTAESFIPGFKWTVNSIWNLSKLIGLKQ